MKWASITNWTSLQEHERCGHQCDGENHTNAPANDGASPVGTQTCPSNSAQSNANSLDSTGGSTDPLYVGQSLKDITLGRANSLLFPRIAYSFEFYFSFVKSDVDAGDTENEHCSSSEQRQDCTSNSSDEDASDGAWQTNESSSQDVQSIVDTIISNKSSKKIYKAVAREWGITCKMSETCRCMDCQSNYFDCEFDEVRSFFGRCISI